MKTSSASRGLPTWLSRLVPQRAIFLDASGRVLAVNADSRDTADLLPCPSCAAIIGENYLAACEAHETGNEEHRRATAGLRAALGPPRQRFQIQYRRDIRGKSRLFQFAVLPLHGTPEGALALHTEITDVVQIDRARREVSLRYRTALDFSCAAYLLVDQTARLLTANREFLNLLPGASLASVRGASVTEWIAATDRELFNGLLRNVLATGGPRYVELEWEPAGREPGRVALAAQTIRLGDEPRVAIFCFDLRVQKYVFETFQTAEARYRAIVEARPQLVCRLLPDTTLTFANEAFCRFFRTTRDEAIGRSLLEFLPSKARRSAQNAINRAVRETQPRSCEHAATGPDAHRHWLDWIYLPVWLPDGSLELHVIGQDATRQHAEQAALRASRRKVADLSSRLINDDELAHRRIARELHDGFSQQIAAHAFALARLERDFGGANAELQHRIGQLQRDIIVIGDSIRLFSHRLHPSVVEHLGLPAAFRALCRDVEDQSGIRIALEVTEPWPKLSIETNYSLYRIGQEILTNLVRHARATDAKIQLHAREHGIVLSFEDNGIGFEREKVQDGPTLGLVSLEERVSFLRGKLVIESAPSRGTHVRIDLPVTSSC